MPTDGSSCRLLNGDFGTSPSCWQHSSGKLVEPAYMSPTWRNSNGQTAYFPMSAISIFAAGYDLCLANRRCLRREGVRDPLPSRCEGGQNLARHPGLMSATAARTETTGGAGRLAGRLYRWKARSPLGK